MNATAISIVNMYTTAISIVYMSVLCKNEDRFTADLQEKLEREIKVCAYLDQVKPD